MSNWERKHYLLMLQVAESYANMPESQTSPLFGIAAKMLKPLTRAIASSDTDRDTRCRVLQTFCSACQALEAKTSALKCAGRDVWITPCALIADFQAQVRPAWR